MAIIDARVLIDDVKEYGKNTEVHLVKLNCTDPGAFQFKIEYDEDKRRNSIDPAGIVADTNVAWIEVIKCAAKDEEGALIPQSITNIQVYPKIVEDGDSLDWYLTRETIAGAVRKVANFYCTGGIVNGPGDQFCWVKIHIGRTHTTPR